MRNIFLAIFGSALLFVPASCVRESYEKEDQYISRNPSDEDKHSSNPYWDWADKYPGVVSSRIERVNDAEVTVSGGYRPLAIAPETPVLQSSGYFVASGEHVTIEVPANAANLHWQIGLGHSLLEGQFRKRYTDVTSRGELNTGENRISSYFGGYLYFYYEPDDVPSYDVTVKVSGVVPSDDYHLGETVQSRWLPVMQERAELLRNPVDNPDSMAFLNWTELHSRHLILTAGVSEMSELKYPDKLLETYDMIVETCYKWAGLDIESQPKLRLYTDIQLPDAGQTALSSNPKVEYYGRYPIGFLRGDTHNSFISEKRLLNLNFAMGQSSDGANFMKLIFAFADAFSGDWMRGRYFLSSVDRMFLMYYTYLTQNVQPDGITTDFKDLVQRLNVDREPWEANKWFGVAFMKDDDILAFFMQLSQRYGWPLYTYLNNRAKELGVYAASSEMHELEYFDFLAMCVAEYGGRNIIPFFDRWKCPLSTAAKQYISLFPPADEFWKEYDPAVLPGFTPLEPDLSHAEQRPPFGLTLQMTEQDEKEFWCLSGQLINWKNGKLVRENTSDNNKDWRKVFDSNVRTSIALLGEVQSPTSKDDHQQHHPRFEMDFMRPVEDSAEPQPHSFNALAISNTAPDISWMVNYIFDMQYMDEAGEWHPTSPDRFWLYHVADKVDHKLIYYPFDEMYTAKKFRFELQSICPSTGNISKVELAEIDWVTIEPKENSIE